MRVTALASIACVLVPSFAHADGMTEPHELAAAPSGWTYQFTTYGWVPWVSGDAVVKGAASRSRKRRSRCSSSSTWRG